MMHPLLWTPTALHPSWLHRPKYTASLYVIAIANDDGIRVEAEFPIPSEKDPNEKSLGGAK